MPELKSHEDFIIDDPPTRELLTMLLSKWGEPQASSFVKLVQGYFEDQISKGDIRLLSEYPRNIYNEAAERKTSETYWEHIEARRKLLDEAGFIFQHALPEVIQKAIVNAIIQLASAASEVPINRIRNKAETLRKKENSNWKRTSHRYLREALGIAPPLGAPTKYHCDQVEKRILVIMRAISAGKRDKTKVAVIFYSDLTPKEIKASGKARLQNLYNSCLSKHRHLAKFIGLLKKKGLTYSNILLKSKDKLRPRKSRE